MIAKPSVYSSEQELLQFIHDWVKLCSSGNTQEAFNLLDPPVNKSSDAWTPEDFRDVTFNHFDDEQHPTVTDPDEIEGPIRSEVFAYNDNSGWGAEYDLPLNGIVSDFTLMFDFVKDGNDIKVILSDCHVL